MQLHVCYRSGAQYVFKTKVISFSPSLKGKAKAIESEDDEDEEEDDADEEGKKGKQRRKGRQKPRGRQRPQSRKMTRRTKTRQMASLRWSHRRPKGRQKQT